MRVFFTGVHIMLLALLAPMILGSELLLKNHCGDCHHENNADDLFDLNELTSQNNDNQLKVIGHSLDRVMANEMPPYEHAILSNQEKRNLIHFLESLAHKAEKKLGEYSPAPMRRLNNREFKNSIRDALGIEDVGTHEPTANLLGDPLHEGFDTHGETLGFSHYHLEQYISATREILNATLIDGSRPDSKTYEISPDQILSEHTSQNTKRPERRGLENHFDFLDPQQLAYCDSFKTVPKTGWYTITIRCKAKDLGRYDSDSTGIYDGDPVVLKVLMGDRTASYPLRDEQESTIEVTQWLAEGTRLRMKYDTDGLRMRGNGNFKFQNAITGEYLEKHDPDLYQQVLDQRTPIRNGELRAPTAWHNWVDYWMGPRPQILGIRIEGPFYPTWPPKRQTDLIGVQDGEKTAESVLTSIATRAWRRPPRPGELQPIVDLVQVKQHLGYTESMKEGILAILVSPNFLLLHQPELDDEDRFISKLSYFIHSSSPNDDLRAMQSQGHLDTYDGLLQLLNQQLRQSPKASFNHVFPSAWLQLNEINFMAPDPDFFRYYHRKKLSEDMVAEVQSFFWYLIENNLPITEFLSADYSFINADLAKIYEVENTPEDSVLRKYHFTDGHRGGLLGMGAILTMTSDSLGTSPIHRAVYVLENLLGRSPSPPPRDVVIEEPDVRLTETIREAIEAHRSDPNCSACHRNIDPYGYAFENFDPVGSWREKYTALTPNSNASKSVQSTSFPIDASSEFLDGNRYQDISEFRKLMCSEANQRFFVRCFITKLITYANGQSPKHYMQIEKLVDKSAESNYRILDTIAAVLDSPLFRENQKP